MTTQNREWTVSQIAAFLFAAVIKLARVCDGARAVDGSGFSKFDSERGHRFAGEDPETWDTEKCSYVRRFLWKYRRQLLDSHDIDMTEVPDARTLQAVPRTIQFERSFGGQFVLSWDYKDSQFAEIKDAVKALDQRSYNGGVKVWVVPCGLAADVAELAGRFGFSISDGAKKAIEGGVEVISNIRGGIGAGNLVFEFPYNADALTVLKSTWEFRKWDNEDRVWRVNVDSHEDTIALLDFAQRFDLTISDEVQTMIDESVYVVSGDVSISESKSEIAGGVARFAPTEEPEVGDKDEDTEGEAEMGRAWTAGSALKLFE